MRRKTETDELNAVKCFTERAESYARKGQFPKASAVLLRALEHDSVLPCEGKAIIRLRLADCLYHQYLTEDALTQYQISLDIGVGIAESEVLTGVACCYRRLKKYREAIEYHRKALLAPDQRWKGDCHCRMAETFLSAKEFGDAIKHFVTGREGARLQYFDWEIDRGMGIAYVGQGNYQLAIEHLHSALDSKLVDIPGNVYHHLGEAYFYKGELDSAEKYYKLATQDEQLDTSASGHAKLALLYEKKRQYFDAMVEYSRAEKKYSDAELRGTVYMPYIRDKLQRVRERLASLRRGRILECYKTGGECPHCEIEPPDQFVFVAMPFGANEEQRKRFDGISEEGIRPAVEDAGLVYLRGDTTPHNKDIMCHICVLIQKARFVVADLTDRNVNVFYELGLAHALEKEVILIANSVDCLPFDLKSQKCISYASEAQLRSKLASHFAELTQTREKAFARL